MEQFEQLLTCAICLDRYRNPKLLPCQHSFCMEPCMDGLVDYVRRQVKCPECRAEHRIPYNGVQGYPTNVTLQRFLELHIEITGELPDPTSGQIMKRCGVCSEKAYVTPCVHCEKDVCSDCKSAHMDILRREITRINNQVRRALHRLSDMLTGVEKNMLTLQNNCTSVTEEVDEINRRLAKALKDRTDHLKGEIDRYLTTELKNLCNLKENLEIEISNIQSNCDLADKHMQSDDVEWEDNELMDAKEIFLKTVEFIRNFETEIGDYSRRAKFFMAHDPNQLVMHVAGYGELTIQAPHQTFNSSSNSLQAPSPGGLMRSKSDHRLASQYRQDERNAYEPGGESSGRVSPLGGRKFGERYPSRYTRGDRNDYDADSTHDNENRSSARSRIRSRLGRHGLNDNTDSDTDTRAVRFSESNTVHRERERVLDTEDVAKGPLSGITRLYDSPRVMKRLLENENKDKKAEAAPKPQPQPVQPPKKITPQQTPQRQLSEDDEIARIKRQNKTASTSSDPDRRDRVSTIKRDDSRDSNRSNTPSENARKTPVPEPLPADAIESSESESEEDSVDVVEPIRTTPAKPTFLPSTSSAATDSRRSSTASDKLASKGNTRLKSTRSESIDSTGSSETPGTPVRRNAGSAYPPEDVKQSPVSTSSGSTTPRARFSSVSSKRDSTTPTNSRSYNVTGNSESSSKKEEMEDEEEEEEETETSSESSETDSDEDSEDAKPKTPASKGMEKTDIGPLLARSAQARDNGSGSNNSSRRPSLQEDTSYSTRSRYGTSGYKSPSTYQSPRETEAATASGGSKYLNNNAARSETAPRFTSRFLKNKAIQEENPGKPSYSDDSKYAGASDKGLLRSRTSANVEEDLQDDTNVTPYTPYSKNHYGSDLSRSRSSHALKSRETSPDRPVTNSSAGPGEKDGAALSSWARYLKNKYGNRGKENAAKDSGAAASAASSSSSRRLSLGLPLRSNAAVADSSDDDQKNMQRSPTSHTIIEAGMQGVGSTPRVQYLQKRQLLFKIGGRGSEPGYFTWPRGVAVGPDNLIVVADSSNHRIQVYDNCGTILKDFGSYGNSEGEFDCLAGVAVNRIGQYIIADRYNHRIQVLDPSGRFLRSFGSQGSSDGRFNYPWGITTDALGFIYVCDKENHRIQVFQSDGTFVGKFGSHGNKIGQLEHPHYIAVSNTNRVIVSDCNNHRIQIFDVNGRVISSFGTEGSENGQFKFPKGVAVDDQGYILVADSGNNRIQIFHPDSTFLRAFGCWGSGDGEFKGLEGIAVMSNGNILVCDRENHRVQVF